MIAFLRRGALDWSLATGALRSLPHLTRRLRSPLFWAVLAVHLVASCTGVVNDYATVANAFATDATANTITQLSRKHDVEAGAWAAAYCGQVRVGALMRRYDSRQLAMRVAMCDEEARIGWTR